MARRPRAPGHGIAPRLTRFQAASNVFNVPSHIESDQAADWQASVSTAAPIPTGEVREIPPLPPSGVYDSLDEVMNAIQSWGVENGVALIKSRQLTLEI
ncbi:hypothetical protein E4U15_007303 [Claviceps sp. LM218 group G6]|nr:hypothetical protein E4U15_007303 [Claviceps sp. LM218 group G6]